jgi:hypothetical protein
LIQPGDHIAVIGNTFADQLRIHGYLETLLLQRTHPDQVSIRNLGWAGDMLTARDRPTNFPHEDTTLAAHKTDVIIACFGMGESFAGLNGLANFRNDLSAFLSSYQGKSYNGKSPVRLIVVSPIAYEDHGSRTPHLKRRDEELAAYSQAMSEVAGEMGIGFIDLYQPTQALMRETQAPRLTSNGITMNAYGYWAVSRLLADALYPGFEPWSLTIDAEAGRSETRGLMASGFDWGTSGLRFDAREQHWPGIAPPVKGPIHAALAQQRDTMTVRRLAPGSYTLKIDGEAVATASHTQWAQGVAIDDSPGHRKIESFVRAVNDKNLQFTYSFKALNQVHIVGERKTSDSGKALPAELIEFNKLANEREKALRSGVPGTNRTWELVPASQQPRN